MDAPFRLWPYLVVNLVAAVWLDLTAFHQLQTSDSIVFVLGSLYEWRIFFWEQDRIGMLIPLLASWCDSPFHNLLLQSAAMIFLGLNLPVFLARVLTPHRMAPLAITLANAVFLWLAPDKIHENWMLVCNYPSALVLGLWGFTLLDRRPWGSTRTSRIFRLALSAVFLLLAFWQYFGAILFLGPLIAFRAWAKSGPGAPIRRHGWFRMAFRPLVDPRCLTGAPFVLAGFGIILGVMQLVRDSNPIIVNTSPDGIPVERCPEAWWNLAATTAELPGMDLYATWLGGLAAFAFVGSSIFARRDLLGLLRCAIPGLLAAGFEFALLGTREWTEKNEYHPRYLVATTTTAVTLVALIGFAPLLGRIPRRFDWLAIFFGGMLLIAGGTVRYGWPSYSRVRTQIDTKCGAMTPALLEANVEAVGGDYWVVWTAMFHVNMTLYDRGDDRVIFALGYRCQPMHHRWEKHPESFRILLPDPEFSHVVAPAQYPHRGLGEFERLADGPTLVFPAHPHARERTMPTGIYRVRR